MTNTSEDPVQRMLQAKLSYWRKFRRCEARYIRYLICTNLMISNIGKLITVEGIEPQSINSPG